MKRGFSILSGLMIAAAWPFAASPARAQHLHRHGDHFDVHRNVPHGHDAAGHLIDRHGHHIDGHGHHTGALGVFEDGSYSLPYSHRWSSYHPSYPSYSYDSFPYSSLYLGSLYSGSLYSGSLYSGSLYSGSLYRGALYGNPLYSAPLYSDPNAFSFAPPVLPDRPAKNAAPRAATNAARNKIPVPQAPRAARGGSFVLTNPANNGGPIRYSLNSFDYTIQPGESQTVPLDRDWVVMFDNGLHKTVTYRLEDGQYEFTVSSETGWDLLKRNAQAAPAAAANAPRRSL